MTGIRPLPFRSAETAPTIVGPPLAHRSLLVHPTRTTAAALGLVALAAALAGCSADRPEVQLSQAPLGTRAPSATVTVTELMTPTVTTTATTTVPVTTTVTVTALPRPVLTASTTFNAALATVDYSNLVDDVRVLDGMPATGAPTALQFEVLARHLASLRANGSPPSLDPPSYYSRIGSLQLFAEAASAEAGAGSPQAASRYAVIRSETGVLLSLVNGALKSAYVLPSPTGSAPSTTSPATSGTTSPAPSSATSSASPRSP
ncbi:MAG: hypothetical protein JWP82_3374 [Humibacillus sp.]|nr:hypothetical protein [Humibacillus sp.]